MANQHRISSWRLSSCMSRHSSPRVYTAVRTRLPFFAVSRHNAIDTTRRRLKTRHTDYIITIIVNIDSIASFMSTETEPHWFVVETPCHAFGGRIRRFATLFISMYTRLSVIQISIFSSFNQVLVAASI